MMPVKMVIPLSALLLLMATGVAADDDSIEFVLNIFSDIAP